MPKTCARRKAATLDRPRIGIDAPAAGMKARHAEHSFRDGPDHAPVDCDASEMEAMNFGLGNLRS